MNPFEDRLFRPMLVDQEVPPFDNPDYYYELKFDGDRCLAYLSPKETVLVSKRGKLLLPLFPELNEIHKLIKRRCVLDGELIITGADGKPDFEALRHRTGFGKKKAALTIQNSPVTLVVFDLLYQGQKQIIDLPLYQRREMLLNAVRENARLTVSRVVTGQGISFFEMARQNGLEGIVAKSKASLYLPGKRTRDWVKIKNQLDDDYVIGGYILKSAPVASLLLGQYNQEGQLVFKGRVVVGQARPDFKIIAGQPRLKKQAFDGPAPPDTAGAVWLKPELVCKVKFLAQTAKGLRHPVFLGLRDDKTASETVERS